MSSNETVISVENLWKQYRYGTISHATLTKDIQSWWARFRGKEDPNIRIDFNQAHPSLDGDLFWALKDITFDVKQGEIIGIIGKNGAGKSTLLKIMSRVTTPTRGQIKIKGRVASLLEVGTGFHPELTGRENVFLNGAILGMTKEEIKVKLGEIISFAEVERFVDTPVKRYSSGMYVRLAFAVAAHLDPDILIVDEVLAVGDAAFQKKCIYKMGSVATEGRTVLFVSHNMASIRQLCNKCILIHKGEIKLIDSSTRVIEKYLELGTKAGKLDVSSFLGNLTTLIKFESILVNGVDKSGIHISPSTEITITIRGMCKKNVNNFRISFHIYKDDVMLFTLFDINNPQVLSEGVFEAAVKIPPFTLRPGEYTIGIGGSSGKWEDYIFGGNVACDWLCGTNLFVFHIKEEWSQQFENARFGIINIPQNDGYRSNKSVVDQENG